MEGTFLTISVSVLLLWCTILSLVDFMFSVYFTILSLILFVPLLTGNFSLISSHENVAMNFFLMNSVVMILCLLTIFSPSQVPKERQELGLILLMNVSTIFSFLVSSCLIFYMMFEITFILMFFFIMSLGQKIERKVSSYYMFFFTLVFSLPLLIVLVSHEYTFKTFDLCVNKSWAKYWWILILLVFFVKVPLFSLHMWLPKAHVEAPLSGSILLSGILLKIGFYGIIRFLPILKSFTVSTLSFLVTLGWLGALLTSVICLRQADIKSMVAYSSVVHMGMAVAGLLSSNWSSFKGMLFMCFAHGLSSPMMFYVLYMFYNKLNVRSMLALKGSNSKHPVSSLLIFCVTVSAMGLPPLMSFFSEILSNIGIMMFSQIFLFISVLLFMMSGVYMIYYFVYFFHGKPFNKNSVVMNSPDILGTFLMIYFLIMVPSIF